VTEESQAPEAAEEAPAIKRKLNFIVVLSATTGLLFAAIVAGGFFYHRQTTRLEAQLAATKTELNAKNDALSEAKADNAALSRQLYALRDQSVAHSSEGGESKSESPTVAVAEAAPAAAVAVAPVAVAAKKPKAKPQGESCDMVGKSAADQAATLQRCVTLMDKPPANAKR
jgi:hypothetical protein